MPSYAFFEKRPSPLTTYFRYTAVNDVATLTWADNSVRLFSTVTVPSLEIAKPDGVTSLDGRYQLVMKCFLSIYLSVMYVVLTYILEGTISEVTLFYFTVLRDSMIMWALLRHSLPCSGSMLLMAKAFFRKMHRKAYLCRFYKTRKFMHAHSLARMLFSVGTTECGSVCAQSKLQYVAMAIFVTLAYSLRCTPCLYYYIDIYYFIIIIQSPVLKGTLPWCIVQLGNIFYNY